MNEKLINNENENKEDNISLKSVNHKLYDIFNNKNYAIYIFLLKNEKINSKYIIESKDIKPFNLWLIYLVKTSKARDVSQLLKINKSYYKKNKNILFSKIIQMNFITN